MRRCVALFAKRPEAGKVKTRLQSACSPSEAAHLYRAFLLDTATTVSAVRAEEKVIAYAPTGAEEFLRDLLCEAGSFTYVAQRDGTLGERMQDVIDGALGRGAERVVLLGSDSPDLPAEYINRAFDLLVEHPLVLGPSTDGGYYLIGLQRGARCPMADIAWSTGDVLDQTLAAIGEQSLGLLPVWYDVDTPREAAFLRVHLRAQRLAGTAVGRYSLPALEQMALPSPS